MQIGQLVKLKPINSLPSDLDVYGMEVFSLEGYIIESLWSLSLDSQHHPAI